MTAPARVELPPQLPLFVAFGLTSLLNYGFGLVASRILDPGDFGVVAFGQATLLVCGFVLQSGVPWSLARALVGAAPERRSGLAAGAFVANVAIALGLAAVIVLLFVGGPLRHGFEDAWVLLVVVAALPFIGVAAVERAAAQGLQSFTRLGLIQVTEVGVKTAAGLGLAAAGLGAAGALAGFSAGGLVAAVIGFLLISRLIGHRPGVDEPHGVRIRWPDVRSVGPMFAALLGLALLLNLDLIAVKLLVEDRAAAGQYQAAIILANAPYFMVSSAVVPVLFTRLAAHGSLDLTRRRVADTLRVAVALVVPFELLLVALPGEALALFFPAEYAGAAPIVRLMAIGNIGLIVVAVLGAAFQAVGRASLVGRVLLAAVAIEALGLAVVVPGAGALGAVSVFDGASLAGAILISIAYVREARVDVRRPLAWLARFLVAAGSGLVLALVVRGYGGIVVGAVLGGALYYLLVARFRLVPALRLTTARVEGR